MLTGSPATAGTAYPLIPQRRPRRCAGGGFRATSVSKTAPPAAATSATAQSRAAYPTAPPLLARTPSATYTATLTSTTSSKRGWSGALLPAAPLPRPSLPLPLQPPLGLKVDEEEQRHRNRRKNWVKTLPGVRRDESANSSQELLHGKKWGRLKAGPKRPVRR